MILFWMILIPFFAGLAAWAAARRSSVRRLPDAIALAGTGIPLLLALLLLRTSSESRWITDLDLPWIPQLGIQFYLAVDGLSLILLLLTFLIGVVSVVVSWGKIAHRTGFYYFNLLWILSGTAGVFVALDLFAFFFFWELMVLPMYYLIGIWGHERRSYAATKFFIFTQGSGLLMLLAILGLHAAHFAETGVQTFLYEDLLGTAMSPGLALGLMLGFFIAFAVKLPAFPFHTWLADAHTEAPTAGSVILAGLLLKTGGYGLLRFVIPLFPDVSAGFAPAAMTLGVIGILYGAKLAFAQTDLKRLIAYTSVSHMGFVLVGVFAWNTWALQGVVLLMVCHGLSTGALFILAGGIQDRLHTRDMARMGGFWAHAPRMGALALFFALASLGLPGLGNFVAEFLVLLGSFRENVPITVFAALGLVAATVYSLWIIQRVFHGKPRSGEKALPDLHLRETAVLGLLAAGLLWLGLYPRPVLELSAPSVAILQEDAAGTSVSAGDGMQMESAGTAGEDSAAARAEHRRVPSPAGPFEPFSQTGLSAQHFEDPAPAVSAAVDSTGVRTPTVP